MATRNISVTWEIPEDMLAVYATHTVIQGAEKETYLLFFQARPPIIVGEADEQQKQLESLTSISARCVAKVIISPKKIPELIRMLQHVVEQQREFPED